MVPQPGIKQVTPWFAGWRSVHWDTSASAKSLLIFNKRNIYGYNINKSSSEFLIILESRDQRVWEPLSWCSNPSLKSPANALLATTLRAVCPLCVAMTGGKCCWANSSFFFYFIFIISTITDIPISPTPLLTFPKPYYPLPSGHPYPAVSELAAPDGAERLRNSEEQAHSYLCSGNRISTNCHFRGSIVIVMTLLLPKLCPYFPTVVIILDFYMDP